MIGSMNQKMIDEFRALSRVYRLLSRFLIVEADESFLSVMQSPLREPFLDMGVCFPEPSNSKVIDELASDYCQLFIGPTDHLPPYQSVWQHGQFQSQSITSMQEYCDVARFTPSSIAANLMLDHLGVQLELMGHVLGQISGDRVDAENDAVVELARSISRDHLRWTEFLLLAAWQKAKTDFYRSMLNLIRDFLKSESQFWNNEGGIPTGPKTDPKI